MKAEPVLTLDHATNYLVQEIRKLRKHEAALDSLAADRTFDVAVRHALWCGGTLIFSRISNLEDSLIFKGGLLWLGESV